MLKAGGIFKGQVIQIGFFVSILECISMHIYIHILCFMYLCNFVSMILDVEAIVSNLGLRFCGLLFVFA